MRRSSSINVPRDNPRLATSFLANKSHTQETESFCYDKLESAHFEGQEIHTQLESLIIKMKNDANVQNTFKAEQGFIRLKKDDFVLYYNQLKNIYRSMKKLTGNWDALFDDFSTMHSHGIAKRNKEVESLSKHYKYKLKALEFEKKSALEVQKNDLLRREQEVLDSVNSFLNSLKSTKKFWDNGINELQFFVKEHAQSLDYLACHKAAKLKAFGEEIDSMFNDMGQHKSFGTPSNNVDILSTDRNREYVDTSKQPFNELINNLSPINQELPKINGMRLLNKSKEDMEALSTKRGKDHAIETSNNSYEELFAYNNKGHNGGGQMQEQSIEREEGGWDPNLEDEDSTEVMEMDRIEKALELLFQNGLLDQYAVGMFEQIMQNTKESGLDREIQMNLFKDMIKLQLRKNKKVEKNQDFPLMKKTGKVSARNEQSIKESHLESGLHRKARGEFSATAGHLQPTNPELVFTVPSHYQTIVTHQQDESINKNYGLRGTLPLPQTYNNTNNEDKNKPVRAKKQQENRRKKNDISLSDLLGVKEYSFELESPLSIHASREEHHYSSVPRFQHVEKEDLLKADSLPVTLKEGDMAKALPDRKRMSTLQEDLLHGSLMNNTRKRDLADDNKQGRNQSQIKIIEEFKNSVGNSSDTNPRLIEESYESSDKSSPYLSSRKRELLQDDDTQLEWETNIESKGELSRRSKAPSNLSAQRPLHGSTTAILKERLIDSNSPDPYQNLLIKENSLPRPQIQTIQEIKNRPFTMNTTDIKLSSIDTSPKLVNHNNSIKGNPVRRLANKSILRNSPLTGSSHTRVSTKANTGFNEVDSTDNVHMTLYSSMNHTMPIIRLIDNFSHIVETEGAADEKSSHHFLNKSFPPYYDIKDQGKKHSLTKFSKKPESYTSKAVTTSGSKWGSKNLIQNNGSGNFPSSTGFRGSKVFINGRSRSETNLWPSQENIISETEELIFQK